MLPKQYRLKKRSAFKATYKVKNSTHMGGVTLFAGVVKNTIKQENEDNTFTPLTKVGFVVSKKVHKRAVKRNRLKRLMRESYRLLLKENKLGNSQKYLSLIFVGSSSALDKDFKSIKLNIEKMLEKI
jgi:ribonuclease P protein component